MALLAAEGFDDISTSRVTTHQNKQYFNGAYCYTFQGKGNAATRYGTGRFFDMTNYEYWGLDFGGAKQEIYTAFAYYRIDSAASLNNVMTFYDGSTAQCGLSCNNLGDFFCWRTNSSTILEGATGGTCAPLSTWVWVSVYVKIDNTVGRFEVYVNGTRVLNFTGDTQNTANASITRCFVDQGTNLRAVRDDMFVMDASGSSFNGHMIAEHRIIPLLPTADGGVSDWTASTGADYTTVDEVNPNDSDYIASATAGQKSTFTFSDLPASTNVILAVCVVTRALKDDTTTRSYRDIVRISSTDYNGVTRETQTTARNVCGSLHEVNPATSNPWTESEVNALEAGVECIS